MVGFTMYWKERIVTNKNVLAGRPAVKGTRLSVSFILELMAAGADEAAILAGYPQLCAEDVRACLRYAGEKLEPAVLSEIDLWIQGVDDEDSN